MSAVAKPEVCDALTSQIDHLLTLVRSNMLNGLAERQRVNECLFRAEEAVDSVLESMQELYGSKLADLEEDYETRSVAESEEFERRRLRIEADLSPTVDLVREDFSQQIANLNAMAEQRRAEVSKDLSETEPQLSRLVEEIASQLKEKTDLQKQYTLSISQNQMKESKTIQEELEKWEKERTSHVDPLRRTQAQLLQFNSLDFERLQNEIQSYAEHVKKEVSDETNRMLAAMELQGSSEVSSIKKETLELIDGVVSEETEAVVRLQSQKNEVLQSLEQKKQFLLSMKTQQKSELLSNFDRLCEESVTSEVQQRGKEIDECQRRKQSLERSIAEAKAQGDQCIVRIQELYEESHDALEEYREFRGQRRKLTDYIHQMVGNARVVLLERAIDKNESNLCTQVLPGLVCLTTSNDPLEMKTYDFFSSFLPKATLFDVYDGLQRFVDLFSKGYNQTFLCYGERHSGKLHTLQGHPGQKGLFQLIVEDIFSIPKAHKKDDISISLSVSEVFHGLVLDLLKLNPKHNIDVSNRDCSFVLKSFSSRKFLSVGNAKKATDAFTEAMQLRKSCSSDYDRHRNLSTVFVTLKMSYLHTLESELTTGELNLVVFPGSEHNEKTSAIDAVGDVEDAREYVNCFSRFMKAVRNNQQFHLPPIFSETMQQNCLNGNSNLVLLLHVIPRGNNLMRVIKDMDLGELSQNVRLGSNPRNLTSIRKKTINQ